MQVTNEDGKVFNVYLLGSNRIHDPIIAFWESDSEGKNANRINSFYLSTLASRDKTRGLCLWGNDPVMHVSNKNVSDVLDRVFDLKEGEKL